MVADGETRGGEELWLYVGVFKDHIEAKFISRNSDYISRCKLRDLVNATNENLRQYDTLLGPGVNPLEGSPKV
jgi:hypothetical protein